MAAEKITSTRPVYVSSWFLYPNGNSDFAEVVSFNRVLQDPPVIDAETLETADEPRHGDTADQVMAAFRAGVDEVMNDAAEDEDGYVLMVTIGSDPKQVDRAYANIRCYDYREQEKREFAASERKRAAALEKALRELIAATAASRSDAVKAARKRAAAAASRNGGDE